jgi:exopolysaccharide production protein ExoQ
MEFAGPSRNIARSAMISDARGFDIRRIPLALPDWASEAVFVVLLVVVFVGRAPFSPPPITSHLSNPTGAGDTLRQILYVSILAVVAAAAVQKHGLSAVRAIPPTLALLLFWCVLSSTWADAHDISFRRAMLQVVLALSVMLSVDAVGAQRSLVLWRWVLGTILFVNLASIAFVPQAVHQVGELDPGLVGDWRGMFVHKNVAGSVSAITAALFLFSAVERKRLLDLAICILALFFLVMTRSKSSMGLLPIALLAGCVYAFAWRRELDRTIAVVGALLVVGAAAIWLALDWQIVSRLIEDPAAFTGRSEIWQAELAYIRLHPLLGSGFGTFTDTGGASPLSQFVTGDWVTAVNHGHNGYLQMLFMLGGIGMVLAILAFVVAPALQFWPIDPEAGLLRALIFTMFVFILLHNFLESDFLQDDVAPGVMVLLMMALLSNLERQRLARAALQHHQDR